MPSFAQVDNGMYCASDELQAIIISLFYIHSTGAQFILISGPVVDLLVSMHHVQSASAYAVSATELFDDLGKHKFRSIILITNLTKHFGITMFCGHVGCRYLASIGVANKMSSLMHM